MRLSRGDLGTHAALIYGAPGSGKGELAMLLAQAWLCLHPNEEGADGTCRACAAFARGNSSDLLTVTPQGASRIIRTGQIKREKHGDESTLPAIDFLKALPLVSKHKVVIIENADRMNTSASHSLLKTLEEPEPYGRLILTTDSIGGVLPTILSRCLAVPCEMPSDAELSKIASGLSGDIVRLAEGAPGRIAQIRKTPEPYLRLIAFARSLAKRPAGSALATAEDFREIADSLASATGGGARAANASALELLATFLAREEGFPPSWTQMTVDAHRRVVGNANAGFVYDALFAEILKENRR